MQGGTLRHFASRGRLVGGVLVLAFAATCAKGPAPIRSEEAVATLLGASIGGHVDAQDFIWEPSRGALADAFVGRRVLFVGRPEGAAKRSFFRAAVSVTELGRPLQVDAVTEISGLALADATTIATNGSRVAVSFASSARVQAIDVFDLRPKHAGIGLVDRALAAASVSDVAALARVSFERPPTHADFEFHDDDLVAAVDDARVSLTASGALVTDKGDPTGAFVAPLVSEASPARWRERVAQLFAKKTIVNPKEAPRAVSAALDASGPVDFAVPPSTHFTPVDGHEGAFEDTTDDMETFFFDMRRFDSVLVAGRAGPTSTTGHAARGALDADVSIVAAIAVPTAKGGGEIDHGLLVAPLDPRFVSMGQASGADSTGPLAFVLSQDAPMFAKDADGAVFAAAGSVIQAAPVETDAPEAQSSVCITRAGHLAALFGSSITPEVMRSRAASLDCAFATPPSAGAYGGAWIDGDDAAPWIADQPAHFSDFRSGLEPSTIYVTRHADDETSAALRAIDWKVEQAQPDPRFIPAVREASIDRLGTTVSLQLLAAHRFAWVLRAGDQERAHRFGGEFNGELSPSDTDRAFFAASLGVAKRRAPLGLRIDGSTGLKFRGADVGVVEITPDGLRVALSHDEPSGDASELPLSVRDGALTTDARERGPRESRADLCVLPNGAVAIAEADFDNHEATAQALVELGCTVAVELDRGAERAAWTLGHGAIATPLATTMLVALAVPMIGSLSPDHPVSRTP